jgi:hypothetical protein
MLNRFDRCTASVARNRRPIDIHLSVVWRQAGSRSKLEEILVNGSYHSLLVTFPIFSGGALVAGATVFGESGILVSVTAFLALVTGLVELRSP